MEGQVQDLTKAYIAGIMDGEGYIGIQVTRSKRLWFRPGVRISNSNRDLLEWIQAETRAGNLYDLRNGMYALTFDRKADQIAVLTQLLPYLRVKRRLAQIVLEFYDKQPPYHPKGRGSTGPGTGMGPEEWARREALVAEAKALNGRKTGPYVRHPRIGKTTERLATTERESARKGDATV